MTNAGQERGVELGAMSTVEQDVAAQQLREHLGDYLQRVAAGERFRVTQDGRPVALLSPVPEPISAPEPTSNRDRNSAQESMSTRNRLIAEGKLIPGKGNFLDLGPPLDEPLRMSGKDALDLEREERLP